MGRRGGRAMLMSLQNHWDERHNVLQRERERERERDRSTCTAHIWDADKQCKTLMRGMKRPGRTHKRLYSVPILLADSINIVIGLYLTDIAYAVY